MPIPTLFLVKNASETEVKSSGAEDPAAVNVAPATSSVSPSFSEIVPKEGSKYSSQNDGRATKAKTKR